MGKPTPDNHPYPLSVMLTVKDAARSVAFYRDVLGFELKECWPDESNPMWANMVLDRQSVMLGVTGEDDDGGCADFGQPADQMPLWKKRTERFKSNTPGAGVAFYLAVDDADAFHATLTERGAPPLTAPDTQFYGIRDFVVQDPDGYDLVFYTPVTMESCQSCGMPLADATPGQMYCQYCTDEHGQLRPYEAVLEGSIQGYFMGMQKMERPEAEAAAKAHLSKMPAWISRPVPS